ncbi:HIT domain-containing protein [Mycobacterium sp. NS-7484]|uniref:HIT family protein n=1 Tax=Mycobacterium sp. NS-7484 TaxID=1834161 RepID=UPI00096CC225
MSTCVFCRAFHLAPKENQFGSVFAVLDQFPVTPLHWLIIPARHCDDYFSLTTQERRDTEHALATLRSRVLREDAEVSGFNVGWNCGRAAGQTVPHAHAHLIPRRHDDMDDPRGGVRGVIPHRQNYVRNPRLAAAAR